MSDQNSTTPDPNEAVPGYQPPATPEPAAPAPGGYQPPSFTPPAPPASGGYQPPAAPDSLNLPPAADPYRAAGGYNQPPNPGHPEPAGYPPAQSYGQQPGAYPPAGPVGPTGAPLVDWTKRALGGLIDYVAAGLVIGVVGSILSSVNSGLGSLVNFVLGVGWMVYLGYKSGTTGVTFGRSIAKTKLISEETGQPIGSTNGIIRQFAHIVDSVICYIGWLFPLWDAKRQTIADKIMKTVVVDNSTDPNAGNYNWNL